MKKNIILLAILALNFAFANSQTLDRSIQPKAAPANEIKIKDAQTFTLENGLKVFVVEDHKLPQLYYSFRFDVDDKLYGEKAGVTDIFAKVAGTATKTMSKDELNKAFDLVGASFEFTNKVGYVSGLTKYRERMIELFADVMLNPVFTDEEFDLAKSQTKSELAYISADASQMMEVVSQILMNGKNHPHGEMMTPESIEKITVADIEEYYSAFIAPNVARLVIVGDITLAQAKADAEKYFGKWEKREVPKFEYETPKTPDKPRVAFIHKEGAAQSVVKICYPIELKPYRGDCFEADLMAQILGGGASGRLFQNLREKHGYTYGCYNSLKDDDVIGYYSAQASVRAEVTDSAIQQILLEMNRIVENAVTQQDLDGAKAFFMGDFGRSLQRSSTLANFAIALEKYNLPADFFKNYLKKIDAVTIEGIQSAASKYILPQNAWIIVVGDEKHAGSLAQFAADGKVEIYDMYANPTKTISSGCDCSMYYIIAIIVVLLIVFVILQRLAAKRRKNLRNK